MWYFNYLVLISSVFAITKATGTFTILYYPNSLLFKGEDKLTSDNLGNVFLASLGYAVEDAKSWSGLYIVDPFYPPKGIVNIAVDGISSINSNEKSKSYPLVGDNTYESLNLLSSKLEEFSQAHNSPIIDIDLNQGVDGSQTYSDILNETKITPITKLSFKYLKPSLHSEDKLFLQQISVINGLSDKILTYDHNKVPTLITVRMSLQPLSDAHGEKSPAFKEAIKLLSDSIDNFLITTRKVYKDEVMFSIIATKEELIRTKRQVEEKSIDPNKLNLATHYSDDYPVIFNIILWFGIVMLFSLIAISYVIATMDPGRDSIIYRMTSTRMKKDN